MTLRTQPTSATGLISNDALLTFSDGQIVVIEASASITLAPPAPFPTLFANSAVADFGIFVTGGALNVGGSKTKVLGDVGVAGGAVQVVETGEFHGSYHVHPPAAGSTGDAVDSQGNALAPVSLDLSAIKNEAVQLANQAAALAPTQTFGSLGADTVTATAPDGINVIRVNEIKVNGHGVLTLNGGANDYFIINIQSGPNQSGIKR